MYKVISFLICHVSNLTFINTLKFLIKRFCKEETSFVRTIFFVAVIVANFHLMLKWSINKFQKFKLVFGSQSTEYLISSDIFTRIIDEAANLLMIQRAQSEMKDLK